MSWSNGNKEIPFSSIVGLTFSEIYNGGTTLQFNSTCGRKFLMLHTQDCCESVSIEDICGDLEDLIGTPILAVVNHQKNFKLDAPPKKPRQKLTTNTTTVTKVKPGHFIKSLP